MFLWGLPFTLLGSYALASWHPVEAYEWFGVALLGAIGLLGTYLLSTSVFGSNARVERSTGFMHEGGEFIGLVLAIAVALIAIPITSILRAFTRNT